MTTALDDLYARAEGLEVTPGWVNRGEPIFWPSPRTSFQPAHWAYRPVRDALDVAGRLIDVELAERRNLILRNPHPGNGFATTRTIVCAYQMILPGEVAPTHRHAAHAIRVMLEARGAYTVVDGQRIPMETGDVVLTPGGGWHRHGHDGDEPAYWLDALDVPLVHLLEPMLYQEHPDRYEKITRTVSESPYRITRADIERDLDAAVADPDGVHGPRIALPAGSVPTMGLSMERLPSGTRTRPQRSTANRVFVALHGDGTTTVDGHLFPWTRGDTVAAPIWSTVAHHAAGDATLFEVSDEPMMRALGYFRSECP